MKVSEHKQASFAADEEIITKIIAGETMLFEVLIRRYNGLLYKIARSYGFSHHDAEDLLQETHYSAYRYLSTFRKEASYKTWVTRIHLNQCYHRMKEKKLHIDEEMDTLNDATPLPVATGKGDTGKQVITKELGKLLEFSLQQIPLPYRSVFVLREMEGFSVAETSDLLGITSVNVKVRLNRAKSMLQKQLEHYYSTADIFELNLIYCDKIVQNVFKRISAGKENE